MYQASTLAVALLHSLGGSSCRAGRRHVRRVCAGGGRHPPLPPLAVSSSLGREEAHLSASIKCCENCRRRKEWGCFAQPGSGCQRGAETVSNCALLSDPHRIAANFSPSPGRTAASATSSAVSSTAIFAQICTL